MDLLTTANNFFTNNVLEIAKFSECKKFISHPMVQNLLTTLWYGSSYHKASLIDNSFSQQFTVIKFKFYSKLKFFFHILNMYE
jgi:hypothetical protein